MSGTHYWFFLLAFFLVAGLNDAAAEKKRRKVIIDTDAGGDDAIAILSFANAVLEGEIDLLAITTIQGNVDSLQACKNIHNLVYSSHMKTRIGCSFEGAESEPDNFYGEDGLAGQSCFLQKQALPNNHTSIPNPIDLILDLVAEYPYEITLVVLGPATNVAKLLQRQPDIFTSRLMKEVVVMGGALDHYGNVAPYLEYNFYFDGPAAKTLFQHADNIILFPLDITMSVCMEEPLRRVESQFLAYLDENCLGDYTNSKSYQLLQFITNILLGPTIRHSAILHFEDCPVCHDFFPIIYLLRPWLFSFRRQYAPVLETGEVRHKYTDAPYSKDPNVWVNTHVDDRKLKFSLFRELYLLLVKVYETEKDQLGTSSLKTDL